MPLVAYSGLLREPTVGTADAGRELTESNDPTRLRRTSTMSIALPGMTGRLYDEARGATQQHSGFIDEQESEVGEQEYLFPWWWFALLVCPGLLHSLVSGVLWGLIWPQAISQMAGPQYKLVSDSLWWPGCGL